ncbi:MAG: hypothetical protein QXY36_03095 [Sulfolobales archaeon]
MVATIKRLGIAAVGDELYIRSIRLLGVAKALVVDLNVDVTELRKVVKDFLETLPNEGVGLVIVQDVLREVVGEVSSTLEGLKILYLPDLRTSEKFKVKDYYLQLLRHYIGISLEV